MKGREYRDGETVLARHIPRAEAWGEPLQFFSRDEDFIQVGSWSYDAGKALRAHSHNVVPRSFDWTQEVLFVWKGAILAHVYDLSLRKIDEFVAREGDLVIMLAGGHGYDVLEDGTRVLEVKNGPYVGAEADRVRMEPPAD
jgi:hypothetical protein